jgi:hypothetical protein
MLPKKFIDFHNIHKDEKIVVCGCGMSLLDFKEYHSDFITIGVNDVPALFHPTYLLVTDHPNRFNDKRKKWINETEAKYLFTCVGGWRHPRIVQFDLGKKGLAHLDVPDKVDHFLNSPYTAINVAFKLGAKNIAIIGVDFTDGHFYSAKDGPHSLERMRYLSDLKWGYMHIRKELAKRDVNLYNLSKQSKIDTVPYMSIEDFKAL